MKNKKTRQTRRALFSSDIETINPENLKLIKEYLKRLEKLCSLKEAEFKMGATPLSELREHQEALYDFKRAHNIK